MAEKKIVRTAGGVVVSTALTAGGSDYQHSEGVVVSTSISAGGDQWQHAEGVVVLTAIDAEGAVGRDGVRSYSSGATSAAGARA